MSSNYRSRNPRRGDSGGDEIRISRRTALAGAASLVAITAATVLVIVLRDDEDDDQDGATAPTPTIEPTQPATPTETPTATSTETPLPTPTDAPTETPTPEPSPTPSPTEEPPTATPEPTATEPPPTPTEPPTAGWTQLVPEGERPGGRRDHSLVVDQAEDLVYLFGGRSDNEPLDELWVYDVRTNQWEHVEPDGDTPAARFGHNAIFDATQQLLVIFGGQAGPTFFSDAWVYDPVTNVWAEIAAGDEDETPQPRYGAAGAARSGGSGLYVSHGFTNEGRFDDTWLFNVQTGEWTDVSPASGPAPGEALPGSHGARS